LKNQAGLGGGGWVEAGVWGWRGKVVRRVAKGTILMDNGGGSGMGYEAGGSGGGKIRQWQ
jgi:hypothetical protein